MNQSYRPSARVGSGYGPGQPEPGPLSALLSTSFGNQFAAAKPGSDPLSALQLHAPGVNSPLKRLPDLSRVFLRTDGGHRDLGSGAGLRCSSPISDAEFEAPSVLLPPSPGSDEVEPLEPLQDLDGSRFSRCSPVPNGYLHFGSTLFDSGDMREEDPSQEDPAPFYPSSRSSQGQTRPDADGCRADRTYKPTLFNLMSKTISELNPTLSPSALPEIAARAGWALDCDSDGGLGSPVHPGIVSPTGTKSNSNSPKKRPLPAVKYVKGDLVWAKFNRRPWWPCHICDSDQGTHTKMKAPSPRPCRVYFLETIGEMLESAWVPESAILPFKGGHEFKDLPVLRRRGKQKEKDYKYTVGNLNDLVGDTWIGGGKLFTCHFCPQIPKSLLTAWKVSVAEAEYLLPGGQRRTEGVPVTPVNGEERVPSPLPLEQAPERPPPTADSHASHNGYQPRKSPAALDSHRNQPCKRKKKCLSDIFGHMVGGSKETAAVAKVADPFQTTTCALEGASKASPYADLESVPVLHRPRRAAVSPARAAARPLRRDDGSPGGKTESAENPTSSPPGGRTRSPPALDPERSLSSSEEIASRSSQKHLATFPASSGLMTRALKAEEDTDLKDAQARRRICQLSSGAPVDASAQRDAFLSRPPAGAASSSSSFATHSSPKRRARKPDKKHIRNGSLAAPEPSGSSVLPPRRPVEVKAESVPQAVSAAPPPPSSPLQDVQELMFKSLVKEEGSSSGLTGFRPDANYKFSTFLMLLKDMHDTREKEGKPLALPPSPVLIKEEPLLVPGAAGDLGSCSRLTQGIKVETGQAERAVKPKKRTKPIMSSESYHFQDFPTNSQTEK
ncbi:unnamed protein product, partial [Tetraodon nigroviridis]